MEASIATFLVELSVALVTLGSIYGLFKSKLEAVTEELNKLREQVNSLRDTKLDTTRHDESVNWLRDAIKDISERINSIRTKLG